METAQISRAMGRVLSGLAILCGAGEISREEYLKTLNGLGRDEDGMPIKKDQDINDGSTSVGIQRIAELLRSLPAATPRATPKNTENNLPQRLQGSDQSSNNEVLLTVRNKWKTKHKLSLNTISQDGPSRGGSPATVNSTESVALKGQQKHRHRVRHRRHQQPQPLKQEPETTGIQSQPEPTAEVPAPVPSCPASKQQKYQRRDSTLGRLPSGPPEDEIELTVCPMWKDSGACRDRRCRLQHCDVEGGIYEPLICPYWAGIAGSDGCSNSAEDCRWAHVDSKHGLWAHVA
ncbi:hypothetical protein BX600DRAFT_541714 [Xylariales sp. PMI_506]|nr:hypothetical protein BX600DRAFT_541714 [Xylariales sp. PMI_506]